MVNRLDECLACISGSTETVTCALELDRFNDQSMKCVCTGGNPYGYYHQQNEQECKAAHGTSCFDCVANGCVFQYSNGCDCGVYHDLIRNTAETSFECRLATRRGTDFEPVNYFGFVLEIFAIPLILGFVLLRMYYSCFGEGRSGRKFQVKVDDSLKLDELYRHNGTDFTFFEDLSLEKLRTRVNYVCTIGFLLTGIILAISGLESGDLRTPVEERMNTVFLGVMPLFMFFLVAYLSRCIHDDALMCLLFEKTCEEGEELVTSLRAGLPDIVICTDAFHWGEHSHVVITQSKQTPFPIGPSDCKDLTPEVTFPEGGGYRLTFSVTVSGDRSTGRALGQSIKEVERSIANVDLLQRSKLALSLDSLPHNNTGSTLVPYAQTRGMYIVQTKEPIWWANSLGYIFACLFGLHAFYCHYLDHKFPKIHLPVKKEICIETNSTGDYYFDDQKDDLDIPVAVPIENAK